MIPLSNTNQCFGCSACESACPNNAITMRPNEEGFLFPYLNKSNCVSCGLCEKVCPALHKTILNDCITSNTVYAAWRVDLNKRMNSTSGGAFAALAEAFLSNENTVVYGAAFQNDCLVRHARIDSMEQLRSLYGSKYVQSDMRGVFDQIKKDIISGKKVLFSGTPCQVAAVRLCNNSKNLFTIDLICHGVPSPYIFHKYLEDLGQRKHGTVTSFRFRVKKKSGYRAYLSYSINNQKEQTVLAGLEPFTEGFNRAYFNRECCFECHFSSPQRISDITIGDYWGLRKVHPNLSAEEKYGVSVIICNTPTGIQLLNNASKLFVLKPSSLTNASKYNRALHHPELRPAFRSQCYLLLKERGFSYLRKNQLRTKYRFLHIITPLWIKTILRRFFK